MKSSQARHFLTSCGVLVSAVLATQLGTTASAAPIVWGGAQNIAGPSDVNTSGSLVYAYQFSNSLTGTTAVNGVPFQPFNVVTESTTATTGNVTLSATASGSVMYSYDVLTSGSAPFADLPANYQNLLSGGVISTIFDNPFGAPLNIQLGGLTAGTSYLVQWWSCTTAFLSPSQTVSLGSPNVTLDSNTTDTAGGLGQYAIGTFTASSSSTTISLQGLTMNSPPYDAPTVNALQVRAVPEPATYAMVLAGAVCSGYSMWRRNRRRTRLPLLTILPLTVLAVCLCATSARSQVAIDLVTVGNPGNANSFDGYGAVDYEYQIGKYEVTLGQYAAFLNAKAASDPYSLYASNLNFFGTVAGISRSGTAGSYTYSVTGPRGSITPAGADSPENRPVSYVDWFDAARFANWMSNGQGSGDTETGAYTLNGATSGLVPQRNPGASFYVPTENEWVKAAFYSPLLNSGAGGYYDYAFASPINDLTFIPGNVIGNAPASANFRDRNIFSVTQNTDSSLTQNRLTNVGAFSSSASFYGTFDQSGNLDEWSSPAGTATINAVYRGGNWNNGRDGLRIYNRQLAEAAFGNDLNGFRLVGGIAVPEPATYAMALAGIACAGFSMWRRRKRA